MSSAPNPAESPQQKQIRQRIGQLLLWGGGLMAVLVFADRSGVGSLSFPAFWYRSRSAHLLVTAVLLFSGLWLLRDGQKDRCAADRDHRAADGANRDRVEEVDRTADRPIFENVRVYTRRRCPLCDDALVVLRQYRAWLPEVELVDVDERPELAEQYGQWVPVVEMDGRTRFRGHVDAWVLERMIQARCRRRS